MKIATKYGNVANTRVSYSANNCTLYLLESGNTIECYYVSSNLSINKIS